MGRPATPRNIDDEATLRDANGKIKTWVYIERRRQAGLCTVCSSPDKPEDRVLCLPCTERNREWYSNNKEKAREVRAAKRRENPEKDRQKQKRLRKKWRSEQIMRYGGICVCCEETNIKFLTFDHINGGGGKERVQAASSTAFVRALARSDVREDIRILCFNCNLGRAANGGKCPHEETCEVQ